LQRGHVSVIGLIGSTFGKTSRFNIRVAYSRFAEIRLQSYVPL
jgi:hypothetical protein